MNISCQDGKIFLALELNPFNVHVLFTSIQLKYHDPIDHMRKSIKYLTKWIEFVNYHAIGIVVIQKLADYHLCF